jgi:uncharacterized membrane protein (Fun14 family)
MNSLGEKLKSRKFILTVVGMVIVLLASLGVIDVNDEKLWQLITIILGYVGVEGAADVVRSWKQQAEQQKNEDSGGSS